MQRAHVLLDSGPLSVDVCPMKGVELWGERKGAFDAHDFVRRAADEIRIRGSHKFLFHRHAKYQVSNKKKVKH